MKRLLIALIVCIGFSAMGMAQDTKVPAKKADAKVKVTADKKAVATDKTAKMTTTKAPATADKQKTATKTVAPDKQKASASGVVLKKDGTPDKRYKANSAAGPMKKDGTPDMRYKANKGTDKAPGK